MKKKNEFFRWLIVALCGFSSISYILALVDVLSSYIKGFSTIYNSATGIEKYQTPIQSIAIIFLILSYLTIVYYFVFCFGKEVKSKLLGGAVLTQSICASVFLVLSIINGYKYMIAELYDNYKNLFDFKLFENYISHILEVIILLIVAIAIFKSVQNNKSIKITCAVLLAVFLTFIVYNAISSFNNISVGIIGGASIHSFEYILSLLIRNVIGLVLKFSIMFYIFFMDKDYNKEKQIEM